MQYADFRFSQDYNASTISRSEKSLVYNPVGYNSTISNPAEPINPTRSTQFQSDFTHFGLMIVVLLQTGRMLYNL
ncbi:MAG: hypothetical protein IH840_15165 [Candidatus Heimdallarchaeota archaeon]|nr:hypothetical protein [Candidatus Heimdallarchaeota archaeon]